MVITLSSHGKGPEFEPRLKHVLFPLSFDFCTSCAIVGKDHSLGPFSSVFLPVYSGLRVPLYLTKCSSQLRSLVSRTLEVYIYPLRYHFNLTSIDVSPESLMTDGSKCPDIGGSVVVIIRVDRPNTIGNSMYLL